MGVNIVDTAVHAVAGLELLGVVGLDTVVLDAEMHVLGIVGGWGAACGSAVDIDQRRRKVAAMTEGPQFARTFKRVLRSAIGWRTILPIGAEHFATLVRHEIAGDPMVVVLVASRSPASRICPACLARAFDLTAREADVATRLASGARLAEVAGALGMSPGTARTHVRHIFQKTNVESQGELVALLAACCSFGCCPPETESHCSPPVARLSADSTADPRLGGAHS